MSKDNKTNLKARHGANYRQNDTNSSVKVQNSSLNDMNSSFNSSIINMSAKSKKVIKYQREPRCKKSDVTGVITHFFVKQAVASDDNSGYYTDLSKLISGQPIRNLLAFFVPVIDVDAQSLSKHTDTAPQAHTSVARGQTIIPIANHLLTDYDGLTLQNKIAVRRICGAVSNKTESKTRHPIPLSYSVAFTQNLLGVIHHG